jgi:alpha-L-rhamnosidase
MNVSRFIKLFLIGFFLLKCVSAVFSQSKIVNTVCEYRENPVGIDVEKPRLSWQLVSEKQNVIQTAYEIRVADSPESLTTKSKLLWSSGKINSDESVNIEYGGPAPE